MKSVILIISLSKFFITTEIYAFSVDSLSIKYYQNGITALNKGDSTAAENLFEKSIKEADNTQAQFELAKLLVSKKTIYGRNRARLLLRSAIFKEPKNIEFRLLYAALMEYFSSSLAFDEYEKIIDDVDSTNITALFQLGRIKEDDFNEFNNSATQESPNEPILHLDDYALKQFEVAERYFKKVLSIDSANSQAILHISFLYEDIGKPINAVPLLERLERLNPGSKSAHLYLGLIYYKTSNLPGAYEQYKEALKLMNENEREDFTFNSVKELLEPLFGEE
ncbi:MAG: tetratricopeptide repeat protein, partial [Candidatus Aquicultor sp.]